MQPKSKRNWLAEISLKPKASKVRWIIYGVPGFGKTSLGAAIPGCLFLTDDKECGINTLKSAGLVSPEVAVMPPISTWEELLDALETIASGDHTYKSLVVDTVGGMERLCHEHVCQRSFNGNWGDDDNKGWASFNKGPGVAVRTFMEFLTALDRIVVDKNMSVVLLAHAAVGKYKNPRAEDYGRAMPAVDEKTWQPLNRWADAVLYGDFDIATVEQDGRAKARSSRKRILWTEFDPSFEAKNRHNLPSEIDITDDGSQPYPGITGWNNIISALVAARKDK